jgi:hypothetical protein
MRSSPVALVLIVMTLGFSSAAAQADCGFYNFYRAAVGRQCASTMQAPPPQRVTAVCRDKTYSYDVGFAACRANGGVQTWLR